MVCRHAVFPVLSNKLKVPFNQQHHKNINSIKWIVSSQRLICSMQIFVQWKRFTPLHLFLFKLIQSELWKKKKTCTATEPTLSKTTPQITALCHDTF